MDDELYIWFDVSSVIIMNVNYFSQEENYVQFYLILEKQLS